MIKAITLILALFAGSAMAQDKITPDEFLDQVTGRTATFIEYQSRDLVGIEEFLRRDRTVWARADGSCAYGYVFVKEEQVCFLYDDDPPGLSHCWVPFALDDQLWVMSANSPEIQELSEINDEAVSCEPPPVS